jgi:molecular chaperone GrpE
MTRFSITAEIARLTPAELPPAAETLAPSDASLLEHWDQVSRNLARLGKQQMRANQTIEFLETQLAEAKEQAHEHRREAVRLQESAAGSAQKVVEVLDTLDDVLVLARQVRDSAWVSNIERVIQKTLRTFEQIGITEVSALDEAFSPEEHEALDTVEPGKGGRPYQIVQVIRRGFRFQGKLLRRAEVVTTR